MARSLSISENSQKRCSAVSSKYSGLPSFRGLHPNRHADAHQFQRTRELLPEVDERGRAPTAHVMPILLQNGRFVVEAVEHLRQAKRVFRKHREFERTNDLLDDVVQP